MRKSPVLVHSPVTKNPDPLSFLIAPLYWMIRVSKFNRDIFKLIAAYFPSPLAISGAAGRSEK